MKQDSFYHLFNTPLDVCAIAWTSAGICGMSLPEETAANTRARILRRHPGAQESAPTPDIDVAIRDIRRLLSGDAIDLSHLTLDESAAEEFDRAVYALTRAVPTGSTTTYGALARQLGNPMLAQRVGKALGRNPIPIVTPCHRVLGANGKLVGFSAPGGVGTKRKMLMIEKALAEDPLDLFEYQPR